MTSREVILDRIGRALGGDRSRVPDTVTQRLEQPRVLTRPRLEAERIERLVAQMEAVQMSVTRLDAAERVVDAVVGYLATEAIDPPICVAPALGEFDWPAHYLIGPATGQETTAVTSCLGAVAETGSLVLVSSPVSPTPMNFLPENHLVVLYVSQVVDYLEDIWTLVRKRSVLPRTVNFITGPSRTADIEQTLEIGAHGPRRLHVLLIDSDTGTSSTPHPSAR